ncbi:MAG: hypothetical protein ACR2KJ_09230 [Jatrophihabitans sp.]
MRKHRLVGAALTVSCLFVALFVAADQGAGASPSSDLARIPVSRADLTSLATYAAENPTRFVGSWQSATGRVLYVAATQFTSGDRRAFAERRSTVARLDWTVVVRQVHHPLSELKATQRAITQRFAGAPGVVEWGPDPITDSVLVGLTSLDVPAHIAIAAAFGDKVAFRQAAVPHVMTGKGTATSGSSRSVDGFPQAGGSFIHNASGICTAGIPFDTPSSQRENMLTAGHCFATNAVVFVGETSSIFFGEVTVRQWGNNRIDAELLYNTEVGYFSHKIYNGDAAHPTQQAVLSGGVVLTTLGATVCNDGAVSGATCGLNLQSLHLCVNEFYAPNKSYTVCGLDSASKYGTTIVRTGDSGGPVIVNTGSAKVGAVGTVSAGAATHGEGTPVDNLYFADYGDLEKEFHGSAPVG